MIFWTRYMKTLHWLVVGLAACGGGCAGRVPEPRAPTMVRSFHGTLVPGYYVSPSAYEDYVPAHQALARAAVSRSDWKTGEGEYQKALDLDPALSEAREELAELYQAEGRNVDAIATFSDEYERTGDGKVAERLIRLEVVSGR